MGSAGLRKNEKGQPKLPFRLLTNPIISVGFFIFAVKVEVFALLSDDGQQLCQSDNQKPQ